MKGRRGHQDKNVDRRWANANANQTAGRMQKQASRQPGCPSLCQANAKIYDRMAGQKAERSPPEKDRQTHKGHIIWLRTEGENGKCQTFCQRSGKNLHAKPGRPPALPRLLLRLCESVCAIFTNANTLILVSEIFNSFFRFFPLGTWLISRVYSRKNSHKIIMFYGL